MAVEQVSTEIYEWAEGRIMPAQWVRSWVSGQPIPPFDIVPYLCGERYDTAWADACARMAHGEDISIPILLGMQPVSATIGVSITWIACLRHSETDAYGFKFIPPELVTINLERIEQDSGLPPRPLSIKLFRGIEVEGRSLQEIERRYIHSTTGLDVLRIPYSDFREGRLELEHLEERAWSPKDEEFLRRWEKTAQERLRDEVLCDLVD